MPRLADPNALVPDKPLTDRQVVFADEYLKDLNATQAAIRAGYAPKRAGITGMKLLQHPVIAKTIAERKAARAAKSSIDAAWVLERLRIEALREDETSSHAARVRALDLLGRHLGMFDPDAPAVVSPSQVNVAVSVSVPPPDVKLNELNDDQLRHLAELLHAAVPVVRSPVAVVTAADPAPAGDRSGDPEGTG